jgi:hypothetical protein
MDLLRRTGLIARSAGSELARSYSEREWKRQFVKQRESRQVDVVFDVGAKLRAIHHRPPQGGLQRPHRFIRTAIGTIFASGK